MLGLRQKGDYPNFHCEGNNYCFIFYNNNRIGYNILHLLTLAFVIYKFKRVMATIAYLHFDTLLTKKYIIMNHVPWYFLGFFSNIVWIPLWFAEYCVIKPKSLTVMVLIRIQVHKVLKWPKLILLIKTYRVSLYISFKKSHLQSLSLSMSLPFFILSLSVCLCASEKRLLLTDSDVVQSLQNELHTLRSKFQQLESSQNNAVSENAALKSKLTRLEDELANLRHTVVPGK